MQLGDAASWATIIGLFVAVVVGWITIRAAINQRQRELRGQLREVLRDVSRACDDYRIADWRPRASAALLKACERVRVIEDEGIRSPKAAQIRELHQDLYDLGTREQAAESLRRYMYPGMSAEQASESKQNFNKGTEDLVRYLTRLADHYRKVTRKMDNGNVFTYWHYRLLPPFIIRGREPRIKRRGPRRWPPVASEE
jgi:hypothetical protein